MKIKQLMQGIEYKVLGGDTNVDISSVCYDSREVKDGSLFICLTGFRSDGHDYIDAALKNGARALLVEREVKAPSGICIVTVKNTRAALPYISANFFNHPADSLRLVGVTGTKGKTTTTHMIKSILEAAGKKVGMIGTIGVFYGNQYIETSNTTPESYELQKFFAKMKDAGCEIVLMEVSSQSTKTHRIDGLHFEIGAFTNLSPDHISPGEHADFEEYKNCKKAFFSQVDKAVTNIDDKYGLEMIGAAKEYKTTSSKDSADFCADKIDNILEKDLIGVSFDMHGEIEQHMTTGVPGLHNVENALTAAAVATYLGADAKAVAEGLRNVVIKGRTQIVKEALDRGYFIIDYAHNEVSTESTLSTLKQYNPSKITAVFGSGGARALERRFGTGRAAAKYADYIILTADNPRFDEIDDINKTIIEGINVYGCPFEVIYDRKEAIEHMLDISKPGEMVVMMGKGHETYQEVKGVKTHFSEEEIIKAYMKEHS